GEAHSSLFGHPDEAIYAMSSYGRERGDQGQHSTHHDDGTQRIVLATQPAAERRDSLDGRVVLRDEELVDDHGSEHGQGEASCDRLARLLSPMLEAQAHL